MTNDMLPYVFHLQIIVLFKCRMRDQLRNSKSVE